VDVHVYRYSERPELWKDTDTLSAEVWPEYNQHGDVLNVYWCRLFDDFPDFQFVLYDEEEQTVLAEGHTVPCAWDGTVKGLGEGIDATLAAAFQPHEAGGPPTALCATAAEIRPSFQGTGLAGRVLEAMSALAKAAGLSHLIAPVRPSLKDRYPITSIEDYVSWRRDDGQPFDPWIRVHTRRGGQIVKTLPRSMRITGTVAEWEEWTGLKFPGNGQYTFPGGLAPLQIDHARDLGAYWEPNVWIVHSLDSAVQRP
jgi:GNAT superfamily N-acetyltransferase